MSTVYHLKRCYSAHKIHAYFLVKNAQTIDL